MYIDHGTGIEPVQGIVRVAPALAKSLAKTDAVFAAVHVYFVYECRSADMEVVDYLLHEQVTQLYPPVPVTTSADDEASTTSLSSSRSEQQPTSSRQPQRSVSDPFGKVVLPDRLHFLFEFNVPAGLPPSINVNPSMMYYGHPIGISYEVSAYVCSMQQAHNPIARHSQVAMRFLKKTDFFPLVHDPPASQAVQRAFLMGSVRLAAQLEHEVYRVGESIAVNVHIENESRHTINAIRISAKQVVHAHVHVHDVERNKSQVALLVATDACPIKRHQSINKTYMITPEVMPPSTKKGIHHHCATAGTLSSSDPVILAPSAQQQEVDEAPVKGTKGLWVYYYLNVHAVVSYGRDIIVKVPFALSDPGVPSTTATTIGDIEEARQQAAAPRAPLTDVVVVPTYAVPAPSVLVDPQQPSHLRTRSQSSQQLPLRAESNDDKDTATIVPLSEDLVKAIGLARSAKVVIASLVNSSASTPPATDSVEDTAVKSTARPPAGYHHLSHIVDATAKRLHTLVDHLSLYDDQKYSQSATLLMAEYMRLVNLVQDLTTQETDLRQLNVKKDN